MVHNQIFEDGRKSQLLEEKIIDLCEVIDQLGLVFGAKLNGSPYDLGINLQAVYTEYTSLMKQYGEEIPADIKGKYEEAQRSIQ